jgi:hypothetical protein
VYLRRGEWNAGVNITSSMRSDADAFLIEVSLTATSRGEHVLDREWRFRIPRDLV